MILCGRAAQTTLIKNIAVFFHPMEQIEVVSGKFNMVTMEAAFTRLESELSFLQVRATMTLQETIRQVKAEICEDRSRLLTRGWRASQGWRIPTVSCRCSGEDIRSTAMGRRCM
jgi:hypothetical protein